MKPTEPPLVQTPSLLCSSPVTAALSLPTESWKLLPSSRASPDDKNQHWSHSQCHQEQSSQANSEKLQSYMKMCSSATTYRTTKESFGGQGGRKPGCTSKDGFMQSPLQLHLRAASETEVSSLAFSWVWFPVADASGSRTKPVIKECRTGKTLIGQ